MMGFPWRRAGTAALAAGLLALPAAWAADQAAGRDVILVTAGDEASVEVQRGLWELDGSPRSGVAAIYGTPSAEPVRLVFAPEDRILRPKEDPALALYLKGGEDHPLQARTLYYFGVPAAIGGVLLGAVFLLVGWRKRPPSR